MNRIFLAGFLLCAAFASGAQDDGREAAAAKIMEATQLDRLILANARAKALADPKSGQALDDLMYRVRPAALWGPSHPAWPPARAAMTEHVAREGNAWLAQYWSESALKTHVRELAYSYLPKDIGAVQEFAESAGGRAWFARRLAEARVKSGEAMFSLDPEAPAALQRKLAEARKRFDALPPAEKQRVTAWIDGKAACDACGRAFSQTLEAYIAEQSRWISEVLVSHLTSIPYSASDPWRAALESQFAAQLPVDSKKQLLGTLAMKDDATLVFRFTFYANGASNGGALALEIPKSHAAYAETLALAPGLAAGQSRVLYRDKQGVVSDKP